ncbi:hydrophobic W protein [Humibacillus xanthopallidus]|uniref:Hydrophobic W protein n=2 Tax=Humibacillus xanthopallidus TaxID=412689 RepID=A0A543PUZ5_9MICO|nr:hydrophobic W protein [Humibacillus xanthopallidus]
MNIRRRGLIATMAAMTLLLPGSAALAQASAAPAASTVTAVAPVPLSNLPIVAIDLTDADPTKNDLSYLNASKDNSVGATVNLVDGANPPNPAYTITDAPATIKGRGNFTWTLDKKPYQIKFKTAVGPLGMETTRTWVLLADHTDPSLMRNKLSYDLARALDLPYSPESRFVDVKITDVGGEHILGNYLLTEKVEVGPTRVALTDPQANIVELDQNYGTAEPFYFTAATSKRIFTLKDAPGGVGATLTADQAAGWASTQSYINSFEAALYAPTPDWTKISSMIDVDSFLKTYFVHEVAENYDFNRSSMYFYKNGPSDKLHAGPVWDFDLSLGNFSAQSWGGDPTSDYVKTTTYLRAKVHNWYEQLMLNPQFVAQANALYTSTVRSKVTALKAQIDTLKPELEASAERNFQIWAGSRGYGPTTYSNGVTALKSWTTSRANYLASAYGSSLPTFRFAAHAAGIGWQPAVSGGMIAGTIGESRRVEALRFQILNTSLTGGIQGNAYVQNIGWMGYGATNAVVGTTGRSLRLEAVQLRLTSGLATNFDVAYRVHVQNIGWMPWVKNGATAGTTGRALRIEAIQIRLIDKTP